MACDTLGKPLRFILTGGQRNDCTQALPLLDGLKSEYVLADKGYDSNEIVNAVIESGAIPVIPPRSSRNIQRSYDKEIYKERNLIERSFNKLKHWRRIATRYDRKAAHFMAFIHLAAAVIWS